jgi:hypothetical protein
MRGGGVVGAAGLAGAADTGAGGGVGGATGSAAVCALTSVGALGGGTGGAGGRTGAETDGDEATGGAAGLTTAGGAGGAGGRMTGRATLCGVMNRGAGTGGGGAGLGAGGATVVAAGGATVAGFASTGGGGAGRAGGAGGAAAVCCRAICFSTSPGLEMCERSILVLISSASRPVREERGAACASAAARKWARTFSASCSSTELECVFFSVTPTSTRTSRIALLLTSSSLARSLIRILLIRPFFAPHRSLSLHRILTESALHTGSPLARQARPILIIRLVWRRCLPLRPRSVARLARRSWSPQPLQPLPVSRLRPALLPRRFRRPLLP